MKPYADKSENAIYKKDQVLADILKASLLKALAYEKAVKNIKNK